MFKQQETMRKLTFWSALFTLSFLTVLISLHIVSYATIRPIDVRYDGDGLIVYDSELGFVPRPSSRTRTAPPALSSLFYHVYTDERGARITIPGQRSPARVGMMTIGCSFTWGQGIENQDTFAAKVAARLGVAGSNFAMGSYSTVQSLLMLRRNRDLSPQLVVYGFIGDHLRRNVVPCAPSLYPFCMDVAHVTWGANDRPRVTPPLTDGVKRFRLQMKAQNSGLDPMTWVTHGVDVAFGRLTWRLGAAGTPDHTRQEAALAFLLDEMTRTVEAMGASLLVVYIPGYYEPPPSSLLRSVARLNLPFVDMTDVFRRTQEIPESASVYIPGDGHPSATGHALIAEAIIQTIQQGQLLATASRR